MLLYFDWHALMLCGWQVGGVAALAWLGVAQLADARLCFIGCILTTIVSIGMSSAGSRGCGRCAWRASVSVLLHFLWARD